MAYFPYNLMPLSPKQTPSDANPSTNRLRITADQYNMHDEEIQAIETFLGTFDKTGKISTGLIGTVYGIVDQINSICVEGVKLSSGAAQSGQAMTFPEDATVTYLKTKPDLTGTTIDVASTNGFPDKGVISIVNDISLGVRSEDGISFSSLSAPTSVVEWIRYEKKSPTAFLNCQRGYLGSTVGTHTGFIPNSNLTTETGLLNEQDRCLTLQGFQYEVCQFRYQGFRNSKIYSCLILNLSGSLGYIEDYVRLRPNTISVVSGTDTASLFVSVSNEIGVLGTKSDGTFYLVSADAAYRNIQQLSSSEAYDWIQLAIEKGLVQLSKTPADIEWPDNSVPVFSGKLGLQVSLGGLNGFSDPNTSSESQMNLTSALLSIGADGSVYCFPNSSNAGPQDLSIYNLVYYNMILVPSVRTSTERNN